MKWRKILSKHCSLFPELVSRIISVRGVSVVIVRLRYMCAWTGGITLEEAHTTATAIEHKLKTMLGEGTLINIHVEPKK